MSFCCLALLLLFTVVSCSFLIAYNLEKNIYCNYSNKSCRSISFSSPNLKKNELCAITKDFLEDSYLE